MKRILNPNTMRGSQVKYRRVGVVGIKKTTRLLTSFAFIQPTGRNNGNEKKRKQREVGEKKNIHTFNTSAA